MFVLMLHRIKKSVKKVLAFFGLYHPSLGIKISSQAKADIVIECRRPDMQIFVETGTEFGTMIQMVQSHFVKILSIELDRTLHEKAVELFKGQDAIKLFQGDSATMIKTVLLEVTGPALFWLDAHGPGAMTIKNPLHCPVEKELEAIFESKVQGHIILIDDARCFDLFSISRIKSLAKQHGYTCTIVDGIFRLFPKRV